jgi:lia operon protein LiaI
MRKFGLFMVGGVAAMVLLANVGPLVGLAISLVILYYSFKGFMKSETTFSKVLWAIFGLVALTVSASNVPAIVGIVAAYVLYIVYKKWNETETTIKEDSDPFTNFEKQWAELKREY